MTTRVKPVRAVLAGWIVPIVALACSRPPTDHSTPETRGPLPAAPAPSAPIVGAAASSAGPSQASELTWRYERSPFGPTEIVTIVPAGAMANHRLPVLVAFHGRGESLKGPHAGARGWVDDYSVAAAASRLASPPLSHEDYLGWVTPERLAAVNRSLAANAYRGVILVCPYLPDALHGGRMLEEGKALADFVVDEVLPRVAKETPAIGTPLTTGVDGVSLGGRASLLVGLLRPEAFRTVGAMQPAIDEDETWSIADLALRASTKNQALFIRLLSSDGDFFLSATTVLDRALTARHVRHRMDVVLGPHSYEFNRGPGSFEMLVFHDRALRDLVSP